MYGFIPPQDSLMTNKKSLFVIVHNYFIVFNKAQSKLAVIKFFVSHKLHKKK